MQRSPLEGRTLLITGGSGTFGTAYIRHALAKGIRRVVCLSRGEHRLVELARSVNDSRLECWIGDVRDRDRISWALRWRPDVVIHAAALKRIEACQANPLEAAKTNIDGTRNVVESAMLANVPRVLVISSDKACAPETVYGSTKAAAESLAIGQNSLRGSGETMISVARYGNVMGSQGSVLDAVLRARETGQFTLTHPDVTRFWWSVDSACEFVTRVLWLMQGAEIWVPKLSSAKVVDLVSATAPHAEIEIIGMRGSEKLHEIMISEAESRYAWSTDSEYVLLPYFSEWWSGSPPIGSRPCDQGFVYSSGHKPSTVSYHEVTS